MRLLRPAARMASIAPRAIRSPAANTASIPGWACGRFCQLARAAGRDRQRGQLRLDQVIDDLHLALGVDLALGRLHRERMGHDRAPRSDLEAGRVVGILPADFAFPTGHFAQPEIVTLQRPESVTADASAPGDGGTVDPILRLPRGATRDAVQARLDALAVPPGPGQAGEDAGVMPALADVRSVMYSSGQPILRFLLGAASLVLLLGCANLANHLLLRSVHQKRELAVRLALGASRGRLVRPLLLESAIAGAAAGGLAAVANALAFEALIREVPPTLYRAAPVGISLRVVAFAFALGIMAGVAFACGPAWRASRLDMQPLLRSAVEPAGRGLRGPWLVSVQAALAIVLVSGAVVAAQGLASALSVPLGFSAENVVVVRASPRRDAPGPPLAAFYAGALESLRERGEILAAGAATSLPLDGQATASAVRALGDGAGRVGLVHVLPGYFEAAGIRLIRGRLLDSRDLGRDDNPAVVSERASGLLAPANQDIVGSTLEGIDGRRLVVVGVVGDVASSLQRPGEPLVYSVPGVMKQAMAIVVRTRARTNDLLAGIRRMAGQRGGGAPVTATWWSDSIAALPGYRTPRLQTLLLGAFSLLALGLASLGTYVAVSFTTALRTREIGIRLALGATRSSLLARMLGQALVPVSAGVVAGVIASVWLARLAAARVFAVPLLLPITLATSCALVLAGAVLAACWPASRASRSDPAAVLRAE
ncbi:MAG: FtsX-like permease family protein [Vicinamibacteria bacterium]